MLSALESAKEGFHFQSAYPHLGLRISTGDMPGKPKELLVGKLPQWSGIPFSVSNNVICPWVNLRQGGSLSLLADLSFEGFKYLQNSKNPI